MLQSVRSFVQQEQMIYNLLTKVVLWYSFTPNAFCLHIKSIQNQSELI